MKKIFNFIFNLIDPINCKTNWFSIRFHRWGSENIKNSNKIFKSQTFEEFKYFNVRGAGELAIGRNYGNQYNDARISIGAEWGDYGFIGGWMEKDEAVKMAEFILKECSRDIINDALKHGKLN
jgi:hypothetical protein